MLATATTSFAGPATRTLTLRLTGAGRIAFSHATRVKLLAKGTFAGPSAHGLSWVAPVILSH